MKQNVQSNMLHCLFFVWLFFSFTKKEDIKETWLAQGLNDAIPLLEVLC